MLAGVKNACNTLGVATQAVCMLLAAGAGGAIPGMLVVGTAVSLGGASGVTIGSITMTPTTFGAAIGALAAEILAGVSIGCALYNGRTTPFWRRAPGSGATPESYVVPVMGETGATGVVSIEYQRL